MKNFTLLLTFLFLSNYSFGQAENSGLDLVAVQNWSMFGRDTEIGVDKYFNKNVIHFGVSYFQNDALPGIDEGEHVYRARSFAQRLGLNFGYKRSIKLKNSDIELLPKLEIQVFDLGSVSRYEGNIINYANRVSINNSIGMDGKVKLYKKIYLIGGVEGGIILENNNDRIFNSLNDWGPFLWNMNFYSSIGLMYRI